MPTAIGLHYVIKLGVFHLLCLLGFSSYQLWHLWICLCCPFIPMEYGDYKETDSNWTELNWPTMFSMQVKTFVLTLSYCMSECPHTALYPLEKCLIWYDVLCDIYDIYMLKLNSHFVLIHAFFQRDCEETQPQWSSQNGGMLKMDAFPLQEWTVDQTSKLTITSSSSACFCNAHDPAVGTVSGSVETYFQSHSYSVKWFWIQNSFLMSQYMNVKWDINYNQAEKT